MLLVAKERMVSTSPLLESRETKQLRLSMKYFLSFFMCLHGIIFYTNEIRLRKFIQDNAAMVKLRVVLENGDFNIKQ